MSVKTDEEKDEKSHYVYICRKGEDSDSALKNWDEVKAVLTKQAAEEVESPYQSSDEEQDEPSQPEESKIEKD